MGGYSGRVLWDWGSSHSSHGEGLGLGIFTSSRMSFGCFTSIFNAEDRTGWSRSRLSILRVPKDDGIFIAAGAAG